MRSSRTVAELGDFNEQSKLFRDTLLINQLREIAWEINAVMIADISISHFMTEKEIEDKIAVLIKKKAEAVKNQYYGYAVLLRDQIRELNNQIKNY